MNIYNIKVQLRTGKFQIFSNRKIIEIDIDIRYQLGYRFYIERPIHGFDINKVKNRDTIFIVFSEETE